MGLGISTGLTYEDYVAPIGSVSFDGTNDYIDFDTGLGETVFGKTNLSPTSFQFWMRPDNNYTSASSVTRVITFDNSATDRYWGISLGNTSASLTNEVLAVSPNAGNRSASQTNISANTWYHVVLVFSTNHYKIYLNGVDDTDETIVAADGGSAEDYSISTGWDQVEIGRGYLGSGGSRSYFGGRITELASWSSALTPVEVLALYNNGVPVDPTSNYGTYTSSVDISTYYPCNQLVDTTGIYSTEKANNFIGTFQNGADFTSEATTGYYPGY
tara:strand:- start:512 stop:1327 length:816 start_codon:yes stop_codon:yes gene_type:complete